MIKMATIAQPQIARNCIAHRAAYLGTLGTALCTPERRVHFLPDTTQVWQDITTAPVSALTLGERLDIAQVQRLHDERYGSLVALVMAKNDHGPRRVAA
jgi:hypothetical protein